MVNLNKLSDKDKLDLCRKYYLAGFFFLPFMWIVNFVWFFSNAFKRNAFAEQAQMKKCKLKLNIFDYKSDFIIGIR